MRHTYGGGWCGEKTPTTSKNKETDSFSKVFMESIKDPTNNLLTDLRRRSVFNKIYSGW